MEPGGSAATGDSKVACLALICATIGERTDEFASVAVAPEDGACPGTECSTAAGIAAQPWRVNAMDRKGQPHTRRCTYHDESGIVLRHGTLVPLNLAAGDRAESRDIARR